MILDLVGAGKRVGVTAQSHKTISNMLEAVVEAAAEERPVVRIIQKADVDDEHAATGRDPRRRERRVAAALAAGTVDVVAGTGWLFARPEFDGAFDVLFVDEASQMSLANAVALGTQRAVDRPHRRPEPAADGDAGRPPGGAAASSLEHLVGDAETMPAERGLFLETSRRMHPEVNAFISPAFYGGRLATHPKTAGRVVEDDDAGPGRLRRPVDADAHTGDGPASRRRQRRSPISVGRLLGMTGTIERAAISRSSVDDVIIVAPYNAQVAEIQSAVERRIGVGERRNRRQVPGSRGRRRDLLDGQFEPGGCAAGHGVPVLAQPTQCRHLQGAEPRAPRRVADAAGGWLPDTRTDVPGRCAVPVRRGGRGAGRVELGVEPRLTLIAHCVPRSSVSEDRARQAGRPA